MLVIENLLSFRNIYLLTVASISVFLLIRGLLMIRAEKKQRVESAENMDFSESVIPPSSSEDDSEAKMISRKIAVQSIESRFESMKKFYIPIVTFVTLTLLALPFLPTLPATYLSLVTGVLAGIVGLAARPVIENAIAGLVITFSQPIRINDTIILDGHYGTVEKINLLHTIIKVWNWRRLVVPNHKLLQKEIENLTLGEESEWAYISFYVEPSVDIEVVKALAKESMESIYLEKHEEASFWVMGLEKDSILCWVAGWASDPPRAWALKSSARQKLIENLRKNNISFQLTNSHINLSKQSLSVFDGER